MHAGFVGSDRNFLPLRGLECGSTRLHRLFFAFGNHADEIAVAQHRYHAGQLADGVGVEGGELRIVRGRSHHAAEQHARQLDVLHVTRRAGGLEWNVEAVDCGTDDAVLGRRFGFDRRGGFPRQQRGVRQFPVRNAANAIEAADNAVFNGQFIERYVEAFGRLAQQEVACLGAGVTERSAAFVDRAAARGVAFVGGQHGVAGDHTHLRQRNIEFLGGDLRHRGDHTLTDLDFAGKDRKRAVGFELQPLVELAVGIETARQFDRRIHFAAFRSAAARCTALIMRVWVPQRQRLRVSACLMSSSVGSGLAASNAADDMITPERQ